MPLSGAVWAQNFEVDNTYYEQGNYAQALREFEPLAKQGHVRAQEKLGNMYLEDQGVPQDDIEAVKCLRLSVEQENASAQTTLGTSYYEGRGVQHDYAEAARLRELAARLRRDKQEQTCLELLCSSGSN